ncbi:MAG: release factor glutamine methyltransferase [Pseudonocardiales bacterium]|nr:release factor glutamine methyltransferase [Pseudonocardiales bacterium]
MLERRVAGAPLEHVLGWVDFCGVRIAVEAGVFVPRRRTEYLVEQAVACAPRGVRPVVVDLCCGSGAVGVAIAAELESAELYAVDDDSAAVRCAAGNLATLDGLALLGDLYLPLPPRLRGHIDLLVANAPYVPTAAIALLPPEAREYEPRGALDGGPDGLDVQRRIVAGAASWLAPGGHLLVETSAGQAAGIVALFRRGGLSARMASSEQLSATVVCGAPVGSAGRTA